MTEEEERLDQPEVFELELELLRWVKKAMMETIPPIMQKPSGNAAQHYGLDSKSRWREAVCVMLILSEPGITVEGVSRLGRQMAQLFRQDYQLWDVKAKQLKNWVDRGLLNVKLLDRTLAYFQNQSSWLQYIKTLKKPIPKIESPGFPGTQWNEFYWKDQTVMLLMQEADFPDGKNPEFCAKLFKEETGKWRLKMEQFKRWLEKGKNDPLPEYYGTGKNCAECGVFLWDTRSYLKHMKRNHGYKIKEKDKLMVKNDKRDKPEKCEEEDSLNVDKFEEIPDSSQTKADKHTLKSLDAKNHDSRSKDSFDSIFKGESNPNSLDNLLVSESEKNESDLDLEKGSSLPEIKEKSQIEKTEVLKYQIDKTEVARFEPDNAAPLRRRAAQKPTIKDAMVSCPECDFQCLHSKIVSHLKRCTKKAAQAKKKAAAHPRKGTVSPKQKHEKPSTSKENSRELKEKSHDSIFESEVKKHKESDIVKKVFLNKFEAQKKNNKYNDDSDDSFSTKDDIDETPRMRGKLPSTKKTKYDDVSDDSLSQKDETEKTLNLPIDKCSSKQDVKLIQDAQKKSPTKVIDDWENQSDKMSSKENDESSEDEVLPEKSKRLKVQPKKQETIVTSNTEDKLPPKVSKVLGTKKTKYDDISDDSLSHKDTFDKSPQLTAKQLPLQLERKKTKYDDVSDDSLSQKDEFEFETSPKLSLKRQPSKLERRRAKYDDVSDDSFSQKDILGKSPTLTVQELPLKLERKKIKYDDISDDFVSHNDEFEKSPILTIKPLTPKQERKKTIYDNQSDDSSLKAQKHQMKYDDISDDSFSQKDDLGKSPPWPEKQPPLKLKLSRNYNSSEISHFEVSVKKHETIDAVFGRSLAIQKSISDRSNQPTIMLKNINAVTKKNYVDDNITSQTSKTLDPEKTTPSKISDDWESQSEKSSKLKDDSSEEEVLPQKSRRSKAQLPKQESKHIYTEKKSPSKVLDDVNSHLERTTSKLQDDSNEGTAIAAKSRLTKAQKIYDIEKTSPAKPSEHWDQHSAKTSSRLNDDSSEEEVIPQKSRRSKAQPRKQQSKPLYDAEQKSPIKVLDDWGNRSKKISLKENDDSSEDEVLSNKSKRLKAQPTKQENKVISNTEKKSLSKTSKVTDDWDGDSEKSSSKYKDDSSEEEVMPQKTKRFNANTANTTKQENKTIYDTEKSLSTNDQYIENINKVSQIKASKALDDWDTQSETNSTKLKDDSSEEEVLPQKSKRSKVQSTKKESKSQHEPEQITPSFEFPVNQNASTLKDGLTQEEILPQNQKRFKGFLESFKPVPETELKHLKDIETDEPTKLISKEELAPEFRKKEGKKPNDIMQNRPKKVDEKSSMKNKWLESLEKRNKGKPIIMEVQHAKPPRNSGEMEKIIPSDTLERTNDEMLIDKEIGNKNEQIASAETKKPDKPERRSQDAINSSDGIIQESISMFNKKDTQSSTKNNSGSIESLDVQEGRPSLRRGKMIPCPLCGKEYAIASNLQKHIDKDHSEGDERSSNKRKSKEKSDPARKKKKIDDDDDADANANDMYEDPSPGPSVMKNDKPSRRSDEIDNILEKSRTSNMEVDLDNPVIPSNKDKENEEDKLTEYEIFQKLQLKEPSKTGKKKVECNECGLYLPTNTIKRHLLKHEKNALKAQLLAETSTPDKEDTDKKVPCPECDKTFPPNSIKKHMAKHKREKKNNESVKDNESSEKNNQENEEFSDERIPCQQCGKMLPKNAMKRHLMKHETVSQESDTEKTPVRKKEEEQSEADVEEEKPKSARKKVTCVECGLQCAPNVIKRHLEKHAKMKSMEKSVTQNEIYAPIEITPTKEYWEYEKEKSDTKGIKSNANQMKSSESDHSHEEEDREVTQPKKTKEDKKERSKSRKDTNEMEPIHRTVKDLKEAEKAKNSEEESESENPLETAVRKVVSYRMTPKQALSIYNLTPKVLFDNLLGETDNDRMSILKKVNLSSSGEKKVINYCKQNEAQLSYKAVINCVRDLKIKDGFPDFSLSRLEAYRWWYAFRKKFDLKITAKKK